MYKKDIYRKNMNKIYTCIDRKTRTEKYTYKKDMEKMCKKYKKNKGKNRKKYKKYIEII